MVKIMSASGPNIIPGHGTFVASGISPPSLRNDSGGEARIGVTQASSHAMVCVFWGSIALGGLLQGRPESLVSRGAKTYCMTEYHSVSFSDDCSTNS